jgi:hypothetical protein
MGSRFNAVVPFRSQVARSRRSLFLFEFSKWGIRRIWLTRATGESRACMPQRHVDVRFVCDAARVIDETLIARATSPNSALDISHILLSTSSSWIVLRYFGMARRGDFPCVTITREHRWILANIGLTDAGSWLGSWAHLETFQCSTRSEALCLSLKICDLS